MLHPNAKKPPPSLISYEIGLGGGFYSYKEVANNLQMEMAELPYWLTALPLQSFPACDGFFMHIHAHSVT